MTEFSFLHPQNKGPGFQTDADGYFAIRARGLPYDATKNEVLQFFSDCNIKNGKEGIHILVGPDGRLQGDALVVLEGQMDLNIALKHHNQNMGRRYIEVMPIGMTEVDHALSRQPGVSGEGGGSRQPGVSGRGGGGSRQPGVSGGGRGR